MSQENKKFKILVVDDSRSITKKIRLSLVSNGYDVQTTANPLRAYSLIEDEHFDIVISDIEMPEMNGLTLLRKIKQFNGMIQVIMITGYITVSNTLNAFRYGAADLIFKPFESQQLVETVNERVARIEHIRNLLIQANERKE